MIVQCTNLRKSGFSVKVSGVGGFEVEVPSAREGVGGSFGRRERMYDRGEALSCSWTYCYIPSVAVRQVHVYHMCIPHEGCLAALTQRACILMERSVQ